MQIRSGPLTIYKGSGALQASLIAPTWQVKTSQNREDTAFVSKNGCVFLEIAPSKGKQKWDWDNKIVFALNVPDIATLLEVDERASLVHDNNGVIKKLSLQASTDPRYAGSWMLSMYEDQKKATVSFSAGEMIVFMTLLKAALPKILGWEHVSPQLQD